MQPKSICNAISLKKLFSLQTRLLSKFKWNHNLLWLNTKISVTVFIFTNQIMGWCQVKKKKKGPI